MGTTSQTASVARKELNVHRTMNTISAAATGNGLARAARASLESSNSPPHSSE